MSSAGRPGILLDRDGTLIDVVRDEETGTVSVAYHPSQLRLLPGVVSGLRALAQAGFVFGIASNQPGPALGQISRAAVERTNWALGLQRERDALHFELNRVRASRWVRLGRAFGIGPEIAKG